MSEMIERVAASIRDRLTQHWADGDAIDYRAVARAARRAMREVDERVKIAGQQAIPSMVYFRKFDSGFEMREPDGRLLCRDQPWSYALPAYQAMIDAILKDDGHD